MCEHLKHYIVIDEREGTEVRKNLHFDLIVKNIILLISLNIILLGLHRMWTCPAGSYYAT